MEVADSGLPNFVGVGHPTGNQYSATINGGFVVQGDIYGAVNASSFDINTLIEHLKTTTKQCSELKNLFLDKPAPVTAAQDFSRDVDELRDLVETLQSYIGETPDTAYQGVHQPWLELDNMTLSFQKIMDRTQELVALSERSSENDIVNAMAMRAEARRLRTKLSVAIGVLAFCSCSDARSPHVQELQYLYERLRNVQEEVENERALNLPPADPITITRLERLSTHGSLIMRKFLAHSLTSDRATLRESSMRVSTLIGDADLANAGITASLVEDLPETEQKHIPREQLPQLEYVRAIYDFEESESTSLNFRQGDIILVLSVLESGWGDGVLDGVRGWFPSNYCVPFDEASDSDFESSDESEDFDMLSRHEPLVRVPASRPQMRGRTERDNEEAAFWSPQATLDGRLFYFNTRTGVSTMEVPDEVFSSSTGDTRLMMKPSDSYLSFRTKKKIRPVGTKASLTLVEEKSRKSPSGRT